MKIFIINTDYPEFTKQFFAENPDVGSMNYNQLLTYRYETLFGVSNFYSHNLIELGHDAVDIIANNPFIQKQWAYENGIKFRNDYFQNKPILSRFFRGNWINKIISEQIKSFNPDIIYNMAMETFSGKQLRKMSGKKDVLVIGQHAAPLNKKMNDLSDYDILLSSLPNYVEYFKNYTYSHYFKLGFADKLVLDKIAEVKDKTNDIVFIGGIGGPHSEGTRLLEEIAKEFSNFKIWGYGIEKVSTDSPIRKCYQGRPLFGKEMYQEIKKSRIIINRHIDISKEFANNMRLYETTGVGSFLITDHKKNISDLFIPQQEIETYKNSTELKQKIKFYLDNPHKRETIASAGQSRTLFEHTYKKRMIELLEIIDSYVK